MGSLRDGLLPSEGDRRLRGSCRHQQKRMIREAKGEAGGNERTGLEAKFEGFLHANGASLPGVTDSDANFLKTDFGGTTSAGVASSSMAMAGLGTGGEGGAASGRAHVRGSVRLSTETVKTPREVATLGRWAVAVGRSPNVSLVVRNVQAMRMGDKVIGNTRTRKRRAR